MRADKVDMVYVAVDCEELVKEVEEFGGIPVLTSTSCRNGSERVAEAIKQVVKSPSLAVASARLENQSIETVVNVQADEPEIRPEDIDTLIETLERERWADMATLYCPLRFEELAIPSVVKVTISGPWRARATSFKREQTKDMFFFGSVYHHIGIYAYRLEALYRYAAAPPSPDDLKEGLEQLRALAIGLKIAVAQVELTHRGIDTREDYDEFVKRTLAG